MDRRTIVLLAPLVAFLLGARQDPPSPQEPPKKGLHVQTAGIGWLPLVEVPNAIPLTRDDPEGKRYISRLDAWTPLTITFDNRGEALSGTLTVRPTWPEDPNPVVYHKHIRIGGNGISRVSIPILNNSVWPYRFTFDDDKQGAVAIGGAREFEVGRPRTQGVTTRIVLVVTAARTNFLHFLRRNSAAQLLTDRMLLPIESRQMPQTGLEFQPVDTVIFDDIPLEELSPAQQTALHEWVCRGGTMITCLNRNASRAIPPMLEGLVPGTPGPIQNRSDFEELRNATGVACRQDPSVAALTFAPKPGATGWADASPVIVHRPVDLGMTLAVGFPLSARFLQTWHGSARLMDSLIEFDRRAQVPFSGTASLNDLRAQLARALKGSIAKTLPPFRTVMLLMLVYGALVIVLPYAGFRPFRRLEYAWALVFVLAIAGAGVVYGVGAQYLTKNSSAWRVTIVEGGAPGPHTRHNFWVAFTAKSDRVDLTFDRPSVGYPLGTELALRGEAGAAEAMNLYYEPEGHVRGLRTFAQDSVLFETTDSEPVAGSLEFRAEPSEAAVRVRLDVRDGFALRKAWMAWGARVAEIVPGAAELSWAGSDVAAVEGSAARRSVFEALANEALRQARSTGRPVLLYETHGEAGLEKPALNEEHWHFGFLQPMAPEIPARASDWTVRRLTPVPTGDEAVDVDALVEYVLSLVTPDRIASVEVPDWRDDRVTVEFLNVRTQMWDEIKRGYAIRADPYVTYGRLGRAFIRARLSGRGVGIRTEFPRLTWK